MPGDAYILWTARGLSCHLGRTAEGWGVSVQADGGAPFLRRFAHSRSDASNQAEFLRLLLDRSRARARTPRDRQPLILLVEDDAENLFAYEETLRLDGFRTAAASTLADARRLLREVKPAAILLDHVLPDGLGVALARELRASHVNAALPIVLVTGMDPASAASEYGSAPDAVLGKPCRPETLTGVLKLVVQGAGRRVPDTRRPEAPRLERTQCPLCGIGGALVDAAGLFHCQQCGNEGRMERRHDIDPQPGMDSHG